MDASVVGNVAGAVIDETFVASIEREAAVGQVLRAVSITMLALLIIGVLGESGVITMPSTVSDALIGVGAAGFLLSFTYHCIRSCKWAVSTLETVVPRIIRSIDEHGNAQNSDALAADAVASELQSE